MRVSSRAMKRLLPIALLALAACNEMPDAAKARVEVEALVKTYHDAWDRLEAGPIVDLLDANATFSAPPAPAVAGREAVAALVKRETEALRGRGLAGKVQTLRGSVRVDVSGRAAVATYSVLAKEDKLAANLLYALVFYRSEGEWRLLHVTRAAGDAGIDPTGAKAEVEALVKKYHEAYDRADAETVADLLDPDVAISRPPETFLQGKEACAAQLRTDMERLKDPAIAGRRSTAFQRVSVEVDGGLAVATYAAIVQEADRKSTSIFTRVFRFSDRRWRIFREHYSFEAR